MHVKSQTELLYQQHQLPIFQNRMYDTEAEAKACSVGDIYLVEDLSTGLVYNAAFHSEQMVYDSHYQNEQAVSPLFQQHLVSISQIIERCMGKAAIIEVGCGKGYFLEMLLSKGFDISGFDPTYEGQNPRVRRHYFEAGVGIQGDGLILRHVLEHIRDPFQFLLQLKEANGGSGKIYIEVPEFNWICEHRSWFDIFYEHVNYFRISDFHRMFGTIIDSGHVFGNQYLYVVAELATLRKPTIDMDDRVSMPVDFARSMSLQSAGANHAAIWGGASKGVIYSLLMSRNGKVINTVIDINPAKQGKYLPLTGLLVEAPATGLAKLPEGSLIYVMNSNYLDEIRRMSNNRFSYITVDSN